MLKRSMERIKRGQKPQEKFSVDQVEEALRSCDGLLTPTAKKLKIKYKTLKGYFDRYPELEDVIIEAGEDLVDLAESKLKRHIKTGSLDATKFALERKGKNRGYIKQQEIAGVVDKPLSLLIVPATGHKDEEEDQND